MITSLKFQKNYLLLLSLLIIKFSFVAGKASLSSVRETINWSQLTELPSISPGNDQPGLGGAFSGIANSNLIIAGGTNFPGSPPWAGGVKTWYSDIYVYPLDSANGKWQAYPDKLPKKLAYGVSVTLPEGLLFIGGCDAEKTYSEVFLLKYQDGIFEFENWPSLPVGLANMTGSLIDGKIYLAGGIESMQEAQATNLFLSLDLTNKQEGWKKLTPWPGPPRAYAVSAGQSGGFDNCFYLFSGRNFGPDISLDVLSDGYEYNPRLNSWEKIEEIQFPVMAGTAIASGANHIIFFGGVEKELPLKESKLKSRLEKLISSGMKKENADSVQIIKKEIDDLLNNHPGFSNEVRFFHTITKTFIKNSSTGYQLPVTTNAVAYGNKVYFPSGEIRPGIRTNAILCAEIQKLTPPFGTLNSVVVFIYFAILVIIGWYFSRRQKNSTDYFKASGRIPWWAVGLSIFGTALSAITFMAIPAKAYATDWSYILMNAGIILVAPLIILLFIPFYRKLDITTAYEYLELRFNLATRLICSISFILFQIGRMGIVLLLPSIALHVVTGIDIFLCISLMGVLSLVYTMMGGIEAVVWTDAMQVVVLMGGALFAVFYISDNIDGGFSSIIHEGMASSKFAMASTDFDLMNPTLWTVLLATIFANITTYGTDQTMVQRYLTTSDQKMASRSVWMNAALTIPATLIFFFVGTALFVFFKNKPALLSTTITDGDAIFPWFIFTQMPQGIAGLLISGIFAAAMSTLSSSMNSAATAYSVDIHFRFGWSKKIDQLLLARIFTLILGLSGILFGILMATWDIKSLWDEFQKILGLVLGGLGGLFLLGVLTRRASGTGAVIGMLGSIVVQIIVIKTQPVHLLLYAATGFLSCFLIGYLFSLIFPTQQKDIDHLTIYSFKKIKDN